MISGCADLPRAATSLDAIEQDFRGASADLVSRGVDRRQRRVLEQEHAAPESGTVKCRKNLPLIPRFAAWSAPRNRLMNLFRRRLQRSGLLSNS